MDKGSFAAAVIQHTGSVVGSINVLNLVPAESDKSAVAQILHK
jgi:hypothetical protein